MLSINEFIQQMIDSLLESIRVSESCPICGATNTHLIWREDTGVLIQCHRCGSDWWPTHWMIDETTGAPVQTSPRVLDVLD